MNCTRDACSQGRTGCPYPEDCGHPLADWKHTRDVFLCLFGVVGLVGVVGVMAWLLWFLQQSGPLFIWR